MIEIFFCEYCIIMVWIWCGMGFYNENICFCVRNMTIYARLKSTVRSSLVHCPYGWIQPCTFFPAKLLAVQKFYKIKKWRSKLYLKIMFHANLCMTNSFARKNFCNFDKGGPPISFLQKPYFTGGRPLGFPSGAYM